MCHLKKIKKLQQCHFFTLECVANVQDSCYYIFPCPMTSHLDSSSIVYAKRVSVRKDLFFQKTSSYFHD